MYLWKYLTFSKSASNENFEYFGVKNFEYFERFMQV